MGWFGKKEEPAKTPPPFRPGFRDVRWGDAPLPGMRTVHNEGKETLTTRPGDVLRIGEGKLTGINYQYWSSRLAAVILNIQPGSFKQIMEALTLQYGKSTQPNPLKPKFYWMSLGSGENAMQVILESNDKQGGTVMLISKRIAEQRNAEEAAG